MASMPGVEVVGEASSGRDVLEMVARRQPDLVLMDLAMPGIDDREVARRLREIPR